MKKYFVPFLFLMIFSVCLKATANEPKIIVNGNNTPLSSKAYIINDRTYVPMRDLFESIDARVTWDDSTKSATAYFNDNTINFQINSSIVIKNGQSYHSDEQCKLIDEKTYVPIRIILELLDFEVNWNDSNKNVEIFSPSIQQIGNNTENQNNSNSSENTFYNEHEIKVLELINHERSKKGLEILTIDHELSVVARMHSEDMYNRNYFSHTNPDGLSPFDRMKIYGISYMYAAENIAAGQSSAEDVVNSWMNSQGHRENILNPNFKKIGIGYFNSGQNYVHYWTQCFTD